VSHGCAALAPPTQRLLIATPAGSQAMLLSSFTISFQGPAALRAPAAGSVRMEMPGAWEENAILPVRDGIFDPFSLADMEPYGSKAGEWMRTAEIKHGRVCMAASIGYLISEAGITFPGYLSKSSDLAFSALPKGPEAWAAVPMAGKLQILAVAGFIEIANEIKKPHYLNAGPITFGEGRKARGRKAELKNGRLAMIAVASFLAGSYVPGSVPLLPSTWV